jgi:hypothetical protein
MSRIWKEESPQETGRKQSSPNKEIFNADFNAHWENTKSKEGTIDGPIVFLLPTSFFITLASLTTTPPKYTRTQATKSPLSHDSPCGSS